MVEQRWSVSPCSDGLQWLSLPRVLPTHPRSLCNNNNNTPRGSCVSPRAQGLILVAILQIHVSSNIDEIPGASANQYQNQAHRMLNKRAWQPGEIMKGKANCTTMENAELPE
ncbi:hypothetical protein GRJ2_001214800 [Grus japonensis]|uniref:Uncharacterized protein n=1 Tax=Grus japonensis TaxID=30415 RepID=A0ABC9WPX0_GRUJA